mmetsp:Transcript_25686/g.59878  ORF Transcript_25686/g.59878 Transcript_25686/m.59878 type:complete len:201 (-) Transcript_25686:518-1120(-)
MYKLASSAQLRTCATLRCGSTSRKARLLLQIILIPWCWLLAENQCAAEIFHVRFHTQRHPEYLIEHVLHGFLAKTHAHAHATTALQPPALLDLYSAIPLLSSRYGGYILLSLLLHVALSNHKGEEYCCDPCVQLGAELVRAQSGPKLFTAILRNQAFDNGQGRIFSLLQRLAPLHSVCHLQHALVRLRSPIRKLGLPVCH